MMVGLNKVREWLRETKEEQIAKDEESFEQLEGRAQCLRK
jgi:hypothetical protein